MLVDDADHVRRLLRSMLELDGFEVVAEADRADAAVEEAARTAPDVVVVDYRLPEVDGLETARRIRSRRPDQVTVLYTAFADAELEARAAEAGISVVLAKVDGLEPLERELDRLFPHL
jgi:DNA-binding NarL/FixJ family response regulator